MAASLSMSLANRAYVVTGGFSGIGLATVHRLIQRAATVHVLDRASSAPSSLADNKAQIHVYPSTGVSSRESVHSTFEKILSRTPKIHGIVNSAGICPSSGGVLENDETFHATIDVNLTGTWNVATEYLRRVQSNSLTSEPEKAHVWQPGQSGNCSIVNIGSSASYYDFGTLGAYTASKHAVLGLTRTWALDFAPLGIRVNLVAPGGTSTPLSKQQFDDAERGDMSRDVFRLIPLKRFAEQEEIADAITFLLSDQSSYITGQILPVNGGWP
jgi:NAD(P)-dependent dehydrogenase (short-subunit alcohol dehydrogenase family)